VGRIYPQEFRDQIVALHRRDDRTFADIAAEFSLSATTVAKWVREAENAERPKRSKRGEEPVPAEESDRERIARLERELAKRTEEVEMLGKALAFFARRSER
jgi:transposase